MIKKLVSIEEPITIYLETLTNIGKVIPLA